MTIDQYIENINNRYKRGNATEHTFRGDLQQLIETLLPDISATNEPKRISCGAPDYVLMRKEIPVGFIEAKNINDADLEGKKATGNKNQFDRYKNSLNNLIFTDYLDFHFYLDGNLKTTIRLGEIVGDEVKPLPQNFAEFTNLIHDFCSTVSQTIKSSQRLAELMAGKARLLANIIEKALIEDLADALNPETELEQQMNAFRQVLIHDITPKQFADVYSQTIAYGMFAARLHDPTIPTFSRQEAAELIPKSNPFLRKLFNSIAGPDLDTRIRWVVDSLVEIFLACNVAELLKNYGKSTQMNDPIIHFYETFLSEYDANLRKQRGVWYTPEPVVNFIVRAVDDILKTEFGLAKGLADTSKIKVKRKHLTKATADQRSKNKEVETEEEVHRVQILDPATGTGTFLAEVIKHIHKKFKGQEGIWSSYVEKDLIPRLNGFELLMASYAMAHLQLDLLLTETGFKPTTDQRLRVYLTNSLEEYHPDTGTLFSNWLSTEANEANHIKRDTPVMCVIGNPPYAVSSTNKNPWIDNLIADYKKDLNEKSYNSLSDDYVKFIRYGQHFIDKNGEGVLAYISNNSFIDGIVFRQMRKHLLECFDKIYILDLHGNAKKKETSPDGSVDQNVFDIMQGVSINIFIKTGKKHKNELGKIFNFDLFGKRENKYDFLNANSLFSIRWKELFPNNPNFFLVKKDDTGRGKYELGFKMNEFFSKNNAGLVTSRDHFIIQNSITEVEKTLENFIALGVEDARIKFSLGKDSRDWEIEKAQKDLVESKLDIKNITNIFYRPFDIKYLYYTKKSKGYISYPRYEIMKHLLAENIGLVFEKISMNKSNSFNEIFITKNIMDGHSIGSRSYIFPLYIYPENEAQLSINQNLERTPNLNLEIVKQISNNLGLTFVNEKFIVNETTALKFPSFGGVAESRGGRNTQNFMSLPYNPKLKERAKELRKAGNLSEVLFWNQVKNKQFKGFDFDRQKIVGNYIVDFYCSTCNVVIEIDGSSHDNKVEYDKSRDEYLQNLGLKIIHIPVADVLNNMNGVMEMLLKHPALVENQNIDHPTLSGTPPKEGNLEVENTFAPIDILDYIYAVLHSPKYRETYKEFLKIDFPRVPYPTDVEQFWKLVKLGGELRQIHLLESEKVEEYITTYPKSGNNVISRKLAQKDWELYDSENNLGRIWINDEQYFDQIPLTAWEFYIGGYQPAQKWLKDRRERELSFDDILHYQKIIVALSETSRLMGEIDEIGVV